MIELQLTDDVSRRRAGLPHSQLCYFLLPAKTAMRALLASGNLGTHRGLPVTAIVTMTLEQLESGSGLAVSGGGSTIPMEVAIRMAARAHAYLYI
jgi:Domain of unknown function (DUF222)